MDEILNLIESVSEGFTVYSLTCNMASIGSVALKEKMFEKVDEEQGDGGWGGTDKNNLLFLGPMEVSYEIWLQRRDL